MPPWWNLMSTIGAPYMWSLETRGREERRSKTPTTPSDVPTATDIPASSKLRGRQAVAS